MKFNIQDKVKLIVPMPYLKTSENMPMLRPPDLVAIDEIGGSYPLSSFGAAVENIYDFDSVIIFWISASVISFFLSLSLWNHKIKH